MLDIDKFADSGQLFDNHYQLIRPLNTEGGSADVWLALDISTVKDKDSLARAPYLDDLSLDRLGLLVAIKIYKPKNALDIEGERRFREEFVIVFNCNHTNLIHPVHFSIFEETPYLVIPYCKRGSSELMVGNFVNEKDIWKYIRDVAEGLNYLHKCSPPIIHQDIKPANILIDDNGNYAITDFGISAKRLRHTTKRIDVDDDSADDDNYEGYSGTFAYMAPERFEEGNTPSVESDIWAFGATLYEIITGTVPFGEDGGSVQGDDNVRLSFNGLKLSDGVKQLICDCLNRNPFERPTAEQLLNAAMIEKYDGEKKPRPKQKLIVCVISALVVAGLVGLIMTLRGHKLDVEDITAQNVGIEEGTNNSPEAVFDEAMEWADASTADSVSVGIEKLEFLANKNYVPALYELAKTFGGLASGDEMESKRKGLLRIELGNSYVLDSDIAQLIPKSDEDNDKAIRYYTSIVDLSNGKYIEITIKSAYRLGNYYFYLKTDLVTASNYFKKAKEFAIQHGDKKMVEKANEGIISCQGD